MKQQKERSHRISDFLVYILIAIGVAALAIGLGVYEAKTGKNTDGNRARQLMFAVAGFGLGALYLYTGRQSRRLQQTFRDKRNLRSLETVITPPWVSTAMSIIGFGVGIYFLLLFATNSRVNMSSMSDLFQFFLGIVLVVSGVLLLRPTISAKRDVPLTATSMIFGLFFPAFLIASGIGRCVVTCWRLIR